VFHLEVFHKHGYDNVDEYKLRHEYKDNEEDRRDDYAYATVTTTFFGRVAIFA